MPGMLISIGLCSFGLNPLLVKGSRLKLIAVITTKVVNDSELLSDRANFFLKSGFHF